MLTASNKPSSWLEERDWNRVQAAVPIACVDVMPFQAAGNQVTRIGLIRRETPHEGARWCLIGGRLLRNETFADAVRRQLHDALGSKITFRIDSDIQPVYVAQYFTVPRSTGSYDPRQHAIGLIFCVEVGGNPAPQGEASDFRWFDREGLPPSDDFGFGQDKIIQAYLQRLDELHKAS